MSRTSDSRIPEERARAVWQRAARLQAEAERRLEERARLLPGPDGGDAAGGEGLPAREVEEAAREAGIDPEFVRIALAETDALPSALPMRPWEERAATRLLGVPQRSLELSRTVDAPPDRVLEEALRAFPAAPCLLRVRDVVDLPSTGAHAVVFDAPRYDWGGTSNPPFAENAWMVGLRRIHLRVHPAGDGHASEVVLSGDLERGVRTSWRVGAGTTASLGMLGGLGAGAIAVSGAFAGLVALPALGGAALLGGVTAAAWGPMYRYYLRRTTETLDDALLSLAASLRAPRGEGRREPGAETR